MLESPDVSPNLTPFEQFQRGDIAKLYQCEEPVIWGYYDEYDNLRECHPIRTVLPSGSCIQILGSRYSVYRGFEGYARFGNQYIRFYEEPHLILPSQPSAMELLAELADDPYYAAFENY